MQESLGHMVGIFDGHRGTFCADYLAQEVPKMIVQGWKLSKEARNEKQISLSDTFKRIHIISLTFLFLFGELIFMAKSCK